jgi:phage baseplate assembly protein W
MIDIMEVQGSDLYVFDSGIKKAENVMTTQLGSLAYAPTFGCDINFFLDDKFSFQNEAFKSYLIQRLAESLIDISSIVEETETFAKTLTFNLSENKTDGGLVR